MYPDSSRLLEFVPEPLLAGVMGGVGFLCLVLFLLLGVACVISRRRERRRRKRQGGETTRDHTPPDRAAFRPPGGRLETSRLLLSSVNDSWLHAHATAFCACHISLSF